MVTSGPSFVRRVARAWWGDDVVYVASALTFDALVAAVPFTMLVLAVTGLLVSVLVPGGEVDLRSLLQGVFPDTRVVDLDPLLRVEQLLAGVAERRGAVSLISVPLLVVFATRMFATVRWALRRVFDAAEPRPIIHQWLTDVRLVVVTGLCLMANAIGSIALAVVATTSGGAWIEPVGSMVTFASALGLFVLVFRIAPARRVDWATAVLAGGLTAVFFEVAKRLFGIYVQYVVRLGPMTADAQLTGLLLVLGWFYANAIVFLTAGEIANERRRLRASGRPDRVSP